MTLAGVVLVLGLAQVAVRRSGQSGRRHWIMRRAKPRSCSNAVTVGHVGELVALGLSAGFTFTTALAHAADELAPDKAAEVERLLRILQAGGVATALESHTGGLNRLALAAARAQLTGAPLLPAIEALVDDELAQQRTARLAVVRRMPVKLAIPLALLILPGFVLLVTAPAVLTTLDRLVL